MSSQPSSTAPTPVVASMPIVTVVVLCLGGMAAALTQTMVIPIQGELPELLGTSASNASWVITATLLAAAVTMPIAGRLGDLFGKQRVLVASGTILTVGSVVCAMSDTLAPMIAGRTMQGLAMGFIPVGISLMREVTPPHLTNTGIAAMSATLGVGGSIGLPLSAWLAGSYDWHLLFWVSTAVAAVVTVAVVALVPHVHDAHGGRFDALGAVGLAIGLVATLIGVTKGNDWGWGTAGPWLLIAAGAAVLVLWATYELRTRDPLCDLRVTARRPVLLTNLAAIAMGFGMMAQAIVIPQLLQMPRETGYGLGQSILHAGLWMAPGGLMMLVFAPISGRLMTTIGAKATLMIGGVVLGCGYLVGFFLMSAPWELLVASMIMSAGVGIAYAAMPTLIMGAVPLREAGSAVGINGLMRSIGTTVASAVMVALLTGFTRDFGGVSIPSETAYHVCFLVAAMAAFVAVAITAAIPMSANAAATEAAQPVSVK